MELEKAIERHLASLRATQEAAGVEADVVAEGSLWTMDLVSLALAGVKSQVQYQHPFLWMLLEKHPLCHRMCKVTKETSGANNIMGNPFDSTSITFRWTSSSSRQFVFSTTTIAKKTEENGSQSRKSDYMYLFKIGPWTSEALLG